MKILLTQNVTYVPSLTGASKGNRLLIEHLSQRGHSCKAVARSVSAQSASARETYRKALADRQIVLGESHDGIDIFVSNGVEVHAATTHPQLRVRLRHQIEEFDPTWVIVSSEDLGQSLLKTSLEVASDRVILIARTTPMLPFGPISFARSDSRAKLFQQLAGIIAISEHMRDYIRRWIGLDAAVMKLPVYGPGPFPLCGSFDRGYVMMINPCSYKGISIFLELARRFPQVPFAAVPTWGTTGADLAALQEQPNVRLLEPADNISDIFRQTRVLLMPSLWDEAYGRTAVEAMLSGIPVLASNVGGLPEAKLGVDYVLPVRPIEHYQEQLDDRLSPIPIIPEQDSTPWANALQELLTDRRRYERVASESRAVAHAHVAALSFDTLEQYLLTLRPRPLAEPASPAQASVAGNNGTQAALAGLTPKQRALLALRLRKKSEAAPTRAIPRRNSTTPPPLSFAQQRLWFLSQMVSESSFYNMPSALRLHGPLDLHAVHGSLHSLVQRHETLRTTFPSNGGTPFQQIAPMLGIPLPVVDLRAVPAAEREASLVQLATDAAQKPFDLAAGPLIRVVVFCLSEDDYVLLLVLHHIISDGWSARILVRELVQLYTAFARGIPLSLPELPIQYADFALWQRQWLQGERLEAQLTYWKRRLADLPPFALPTDYPRPAVQNFHSARAEFRVGSRLVEKLAALGREEGATLFMTMLAAFQVLLARYTQERDVVVGTPIANRTRTEIEGLIGCFVNMLIIRSDLDRAITFREALRRVRDGTTEAYAHQDLPFEKLVEELHPARDLGRHPLFQILFQLYSESSGHQSLAGLTIEPLEIEKARLNFDLVLAMAEYPDELRGQFEYSTELFTTATIVRMSDHLLVLLQAVADDPDRALGQLPLLTEAEHRALTRERFVPLPPVPSGHICLHHLFEAHTCRTPDRIALTVDGQQFSYRLLHDRAEHLARYLRAASVGPETLVGVCQERKFHLLVSLLAILKAGGAYLPLDPDYPAERLALMIEDSRAPIILTQRSLRERLPSTGARIICLDEGWAQAETVEVPRLAEVAPEQLAYLIYTSGSTGRPKGVAITHGSAVALLHWARQIFSDDELSGTLASTSVCFDLSVFELFTPLSWGGRVILVDSILHVPLVAGVGIKLINSVPSAITELLRLNAIPTTVQTVNLAGEPLPQYLVTQLYQQPAIRRVWNLYGPSEDTTYSTAALVQSGELPPIGRAVAGTWVYVLDDNLQLVPDGMAGELYLGGAGLARGYLGRPELTAERFLPDPFSSRRGSRMYKTGDRARYRADGQIEYLGRLDHQVKLRGFRIELGEIEARLAEHPDVREVVVVAQEHAAGEKQLVAYVIPTDTSPARSLQLDTQRSSALRLWLQERLPRSMIPSEVIFLDAFPLNANGKLNRSALPVPGLVQGTSHEHRQLSPTEEIIAGIWAAVLHGERIGTDDDFFALGGHSLLATQVIARIQSAFQIALSVQSMFETPTVAGLAKRIEALQQGGSLDNQAPIALAPRDRALPASFAQERLWSLQQQDPGMTRYNIPIRLRFRGGLDVGVLGRGLRDLMQRHEALRTTFTQVNGQLIQIINPVPALALDVLDLRALPSAVVEQAAQRLTYEEAQQPFDLATGPLLRACVLLLTGDEAIFLMTMHHSISDGWSLGIIARELTALYSGYQAGIPSRLPDLPIQYADFAWWQRQWLQGEVLDTLLTYWKSQLEDASPFLALPTDYPRPAIQTYRGSVEYIQLSAELSGKLKDLARQEGATLFMVLLAGFNVLLHAFSGATDIVVGTSIANRRRAEFEQTIGLFFNLLPIRVRLDPNMAFSELVRQARDLLLEAYAYQDLPFKVLREHLELPASPNYAPFLQAQLVLQNFAVPDLQLPGVTVEPLALDPGAAKSDVILSLREEAGCLRGGMEYATDLFHQSTIAAMLLDFQTLLEQAVAHPDATIGNLCVRLSGKLQATVDIG